MTAGGGKKDASALQLSDNELVRQLKRGDKAAFRALVAFQAGPLLKLAFHLLGNQQDAEDVVQETMLAAVQRIRSFEERSTISTWLRSILMFQASKLRRSHKVRSSLSLENLDEPIEAPNGCQSAESAVDCQIDLTGMLERLSPEHREVIVLRELEQLTYDEISQVLKLPRGTVMSRLHRARQEIKQRQQTYADLT